MPASDLSWIVISDGAKDIGDIGFVGNRWGLIRAYYEDSEANEDGTVSWTEGGIWKASLFKSNGFQIARVAFTAAHDMRVLRKDGTFAQVGEKMRLGFAASLVLDGFQSVYLKGHAGKIATMAVSGRVAKFVVNKATEKLVAEAVKAMR